jgi:hypothetical protein
MRNALKTDSEYPMGRNHLVKLSEMNIKEVKCDGIYQGWVLMNVVIAFELIECREFLDKWKDY